MSQPRDRMWCLFSHNKERLPWTPNAMATNECQFRILFFTSISSNRRKFFENWKSEELPVKFSENNNLGMIITCHRTNKLTPTKFKKNTSLKRTQQFILHALIYGLYMEAYNPRTVVELNRLKNTRADLVTQRINLLL